ncbi:MAG: coenzyme F420-0:L-glutamate ligase [Defluviitaleaceae bacterium]|nr:coenzyme F420-0:L-glutamate ligase [Defluviitaleaceae bacterium]
MRHFGVTARGLRLPIISKGDPLTDIITEELRAASESEELKICPDDVIAVTEAVVAKAQGSYATLDHIARDVSEKFPGGTAGIVFPIMSRNRFYNILKGIARGLSQVYILLSWPDDEVGNPVFDKSRIDEITDALPPGPVPSEVFKKIAGVFNHPFTGVDYISLYESVGSHVKVYLSNDPRDILKLTPHALVSEIHTRNLTKARLVKAGAKTVYTLSDILSAPVGDGGFNPDYGVLGSNIATDELLKLYPRECDSFISELSEKISAFAGCNPEIMVYGDGAFKDPARGIWELADPVVSPAYTRRLGLLPDEVKIKMVADQYLGDLRGKAKTEAVKEFIRNRTGENIYSEGTTPRMYADLLGSLCDLMSGSGEKGTPVVWIKGYFDSYADE